MRICIVTALTIPDFVDPALTITASERGSAPQLGVLCLTASLLEHGFDPFILNLDELFVEFLTGSPQQRKPDDFFRFLVRQLEPLSFDVFGFSTICSSYPLTLRLANEVKRLHPEAWVIFGGPQASVVDEATLDAFPCVDVVVRGEADDTLPLLLRTQFGADLPSGMNDVHGITFRNGPRVTRTPNAPIIQDLDALPLPAFHLDPHIKERRSLHLEIGRGCPYTCTFCSTNDFFRRHFRLKSTPAIIAQMKYLKNTYGISNFSLVHDMYTINRKKVVEFCQALIDCEEDFIWSCSARTDRIDDELIALMAKAGCRGIFFGIETGSTRLQGVINKNLDLNEATNRIRAAGNQGVSTAVALITGFPDETKEDLRDTVHYFVDSLRFEKAQPQLSLLAPLAKTPIQIEHQAKLVLDNTFSDMSHQGWRQESAEIDLIRAFPAIFSNFYAVPTSRLDREYITEVRAFVVALTTWFRWLPVALLQDRGDFLEVFDRWRAWRAANVADDFGATPEAPPYHNRRQFPEEFLQFIRSYYLPEMARAPMTISAVLDSEVFSQQWDEEGELQESEELKFFTLGSYPYQPRNSWLIELGLDYKEILESLRNREDLARISIRRVAVVFQQTDQREILVRQLKPIAVELLRLCNGRRTVSKIIEQFASRESEVAGVAAKKVCAVGLQRLGEEALISFSSRPVKGSRKAWKHGSVAAGGQFIEPSHQTGQSPMVH